MGLTYAPEAVEFLRTVAPGPKRKLRHALDALKRDPRPPGMDWRRLESSSTVDQVYRLAVGDYRIAYVLRGRNVRIVKVFHRGEGYSWLERLGY